MKRRALSTALAILAVAGCLLLVIKILDHLARQPSPLITARWVRSVQRDDSVLLTFAITNHTTKLLMVYPFEVSVRSGSVWRQCFSCQGLDPESVTLAPHGSASYTCQATNLPVGPQLKLAMSIQGEMTGLRGLWMRYEIRRHGNKAIPLFPSGRRFKLFGLVGAAVSEEFVEPEGKVTATGGEEANQ